MKSKTSQKGTESQSQKQGPSDDNLHCMERQFAEEIVKDVIESAKEKMTSSNSNVESNRDVTKTETLYQDIPADGSEGEEISDVEHKEVLEATSKHQEELKESEMKEDKVGEDDGDVKEDEEKDDGEGSEEDERFVVDEEVLKEREANLTDEEKQVSSKRS